MSKYFSLQMYARGWEKDHSNLWPWPVGHSGRCFLDDSFLNQEGGEYNSAREWNPRWNLADAPWSFIKGAQASWCPQAACWQMENVDWPGYVPAAQGGSQGQTTGCCSDGAPGIRRLDFDGFSTPHSCSERHDRAQFLIGYCSASWQVRSAPVNPKKMNCWFRILDDFFFAKFSFF